VHGAAKGGRRRTQTKGFATEGTERRDFGQDQQDVQDDVWMGYDPLIFNFLILLIL
jgi:hypothetical protein